MFDIENILDLSVPNNALGSHFLRGGHPITQYIINGQEWIHTGHCYDGEDAVKFHVERVLMDVQTLRINKIFRTSENKLCKALLGGYVANPKDKK